MNVAKNPIPQCSPDSPEWAFQATAMINRLVSLRDALIWWIECSEGHDDHGWCFWLEDDATEELAATCNAAWAEVEQALEKTK